MPSAFASIDNLHKQPKSSKKSVSSASASVDPFKESIYSWVQQSATSGSQQSITQTTDSQSNLQHHGQHKPSYRSIHAPQVRKEFKIALVGKSATMGPLHVPAEDPKQYLQSGLHDKRFTDILKQRDEKYEIAKARHIQHLETAQPLWEPKYPKETPVDVPQYPKKGQKRSTDLDSYREKKDYGQVPKYLSKRKQDSKRMAEVEKELKKSNIKVPVKGLVPLEESDRLQILAGLQEQWQLLTKEFQKLPLVIDTVPKINRKLDLEGKLKQIEADIEKFSRTNIMVYNA